VKASASNQKTLSSDYSLGQQSNPSPLPKHFDHSQLERHHPSKNVSSILEGYSNLLDAVVEVSTSDSGEGQPYLQARSALCQFFTGYTRTIFLQFLPDEQH
jgi:hypothetical protein